MCWKWGEINFMEKHWRQNQQNPEKGRKKLNCEKLTSNSLPLHLELLRKHCGNGLNSKTRLLYRGLTISAGICAVRRPFHAVAVEVLKSTLCNIQNQHFTLILYVFHILMNPLHACKQKVNCTISRCITF